MYESREKDTPALESPNDYCALLSAAPFLTLIWLEFKVKSIRIQSIICLLICPVEKKSIQKSQEKKYLNIAIFIKVWSASGRWPKLDAAYTHTHTHTIERERMKEEFTWRAAAVGPEGSVRRQQSRWSYSRQLFPSSRLVLSITSQGRGKKCVCVLFYKLCASSCRCLSSCWID